RSSEEALSTLRRHDLLRLRVAEETSEVSEDFGSLGSFEVPMPKGQPEPGELGFYMALAHVGFEMVAPLGIGIALDYYFGWEPWAPVIGFVLGFVGGFFHLLAILKRHNTAKRSRPPDQTP